MCLLACPCWYTASSNFPHLCPPLTPERDRLYSSKLMINGEGGSCLGNQENQEGLPSPPKSGLEPKKGLVFSHSLATSFPPAGSVTSASVWRIIRNRSASVGFPFHLPVNKRVAFLFTISCVLGTVSAETAGYNEPALWFSGYYLPGGVVKGEKKKNWASMIRKVS